MTPNEILEQEKLDEIDPLRHLRQDDDDAFVPPQPVSVQKQIETLHFGPLDLKLLVDAGPGCGGIAWPAGQVLSNYLVHRGPLQGRRILELGSGTGLVGLVAAQLGAEVIITDQLPLLDIMNQNIALNNLENAVTSMVLDWGKPLLPSLGPIDIILAADCVYFEPSFPLLVQTLQDLCTIANPGFEILFCYKQRRKADKRFFTLLKKHFTWTEVEDSPDREVYKKDAISLLRLFPKSQH